MSYDPRDAYLAADTDRARSGGFRLGTVIETDFGRARVKIDQGGGAVTDWIPWVTWAAGRLKVWSPPVVGEQALVLAASGELDQAVAVPAAFSQQGQFPAPSSDPDETLIKWEDGSLIRYHLIKKEMEIISKGSLKLKADGAIEQENMEEVKITSATKITITAPIIEINGLTTINTLVSS